MTFDVDTLAPSFLHTTRFSRFLPHVTMELVPSPTLPQLNNDVILYLISLTTDASSLAAWARTERQFVSPACKQLYDEVKITRPDAVVPFLRTLVSDVYRLPCVCRSRV